MYNAVLYFIFNLYILIYKSKVLIEEEEIQSERAIEKEKVKKLHGVSYMMANLKYWHSYLCYNEEEYKKLQASFRLPTPAKKQR